MPALIFAGITEPASADGRVSGAAARFFDGYAVRAAVLNGLSTDHDTDWNRVRPRRHPWPPGPSHRPRPGWGWGWGWPWYPHFPSWPSPPQTSRPTPTPRPRHTTGTRTHAPAAAEPASSSPSPAATSPTPSLTPVASLPAEPAAVATPPAVARTGRPSSFSWAILLLVALVAAVVAGRRRAVRALAWSRRTGPGRHRQPALALESGAAPVMAAEADSVAVRTLVTPGAAHRRRSVRVGRAQRRRPRRTHGAAASAGSPWGVDPFAVQALALVGPGAGDAVRAMAAGLLGGTATEVVVTRQDAADLFGLEGRAVAGLLVTDDLAAAKEWLAAPGPRRLLITTAGLDQVEPVLKYGQAHAVSLAAWRYDTAEIGADGEVTALTGPDPYLREVITGPLTLLSKAAARDRLTAP